MNESKILLIDGMALLFRSFFATAMSGYYMVNSKGQPTNGVHGFVKHMLTAVNKFQPTHVVCCWDMGSTTFRTELFEGYKANRNAPPIELIPQFDLVKEVAACFDIPNIGLVGFEADDCIGTLAKKYGEHGKVSILTGDQDILQLLDDNISVVLLQKGYGNYNVYDPTTFFEEKGITPSQMIDLKALMGDSSDNYPGVRGIGEKTAIKLLQQYETIEGILENLDSLTKGQRSKIQEDLEMLHLSRKLAKIHCEVPISCSLEDATITIDRNKVLDKFTELEFKGLEKLIG
ncbi:5'-3' exonuclease H3TH domain-containing protein [Cytobacillus sp. S13-E01]|uniref:5'-3' exonuclease n=1 Tax=Cytobacillus sp. S13-E01 TaxID=3031326 RepID=UPI0023D88412|nr:5'-3' exonuclease H3TH domain-containing protein [Cytobacillus sp. S13-E01]MDF0727902.1 5'-3' exonuclease H3TH domain-containing protein [Cytobacillus sp. S13-E01]